MEVGGTLGTWSTAEQTDGSTDAFITATSDINIQHQPDTQIKTVSSRCIYIAYQEQRRG